MTFLNVMKCVFCFRWSCPKRYQIGNRTYYSHLGFVRTECPKKRENHTFLTMDERREKAKLEYAERKKAEEQQTKQAEIKRIVLVDDNEQFVEELAEFIEKPNKSECIAFTNPEVLLKHLKETHVDILVTDYEMPEMNGCELAKAVLEKYPDTRIVIMSGHDASYLEQICKKAEIYGRVELICKSNIDFFSTLA